VLGAAFRLTTIWALVNHGGRVLARRGIAPGPGAQHLRDDVDGDGEDDRAVLLRRDVV
jgi:hypothetical protein